MRRLTIIGGGAWGTALAVIAGRAGSLPVIWTRHDAVAAAINERHENPALLPQIRLDPPIAATTDLAAAVDSDAAILAVPAQSQRAALTRLREHLPAGVPLLHCAKGIETSSFATMSEIGREILPASPFAVLSGPSFAAEVARGLPAAVTVASRDAVLARAFAAALANDRFRPYLSDDPIGAEIGGAVKNVLAIACGMILGRGYGDNARAALITRGLAEMVRLGTAKGGRAETFAGLSGIGDLVLTCSAVQSRNYTLGLALGRGRKLVEALAERRTTIEGVATAAAVVGLAQRYGVEMPISEAVDTVLHHGVPIDTMAERLLRRPHRAE